MSFRPVVIVPVIALVGMFASFAHADEIARQEIIVELFRVMQYESLVDQTSDVAAGHIIDQIKSERPKLDGKTETELRDLTRDFFAELKPQMMLFFGQSMAKHFHEEELRQILAFYKTDAGRRSVEVMPQLAKETMNWMSQIIGTRVPHLVESIEVHLKKKEHQL